MATRVQDLAWTILSFTHTALDVCESTEKGQGCELLAILRLFMRARLCIEAE